MDRDDFQEIVKRYYGIYQYFRSDEIVEAMLEDGAKLVLIRVQNSRSETKISDEMSAWDAADPAGRKNIEDNLVASDGKII